jgi:hypothetical protein
VARDGRRRDRPYGAEVGAGVVFRDPDDQAGHYQANDRTDEKCLPSKVDAHDAAEADQGVGNKPDRDE